MYNMFTPPPRERGYRGRFLVYIKLLIIFRLLTAITKKKYTKCISYKSFLIFCACIAGFLCFLDSALVSIVSDTVFALKKQLNKYLATLISTNKVVSYFNKIRQRRFYTVLAYF